jgi:hypothetical protein
MNGSVWSRGFILAVLYNLNTWGRNIICTIFYSLVITSFFSVGTSYGQFRINGYVEPAYAVRFSDDGPIEDQIILREVRTMLENHHFGSSGEQLSLRLLLDYNRLDGPGIEIREASLMIPLGSYLEISAGRQVLSWGPAQYEFVNDRFAKDYRSFLLGRDTEFLKAPDDGLRMSWFPGWADLDIIWMPEFEPDRLGEGRMIPVFDPVGGSLVTDADAPGAVSPEPGLENGEYHIRIRRLLGRWEVAAYGYHGFTGIPEGFENGLFFHPGLTAAGGSVRGPLLSGTVWLEWAYEDIRDPRAGKTFEVTPDRGIGLLGYQIQPTPITWYMFQGMWMKALRAEELHDFLTSENLEDVSVWSEQNRFSLQIAAGRSFLEERLKFMLRGFWGITDEDGHIRSEISYEWSDAVKISAGLHVFHANNASSRFGAVDKHDLAYLRIRYGF